LNTAIAVLSDRATELTEEIRGALLPLSLSLSLSFPIFAAEIAPKKVAVVVVLKVA
jgi:hypothetical protein